jgi:hypothetical protein
MQLKDLSKNQRIILEMLDRQGPLKRADIKAAVVPHTMAEGNVSATLNRLEGFGMVAAPVRIGRAWSITDDGAALFEAPGAPYQESAAEPEPEPDPEPDFDPDPDGEPDPEPAAVSMEVRVEQALWEFRTRMKSGYAVPAATLYVYHSVLADLPEALQEQLAPLTHRLSAQP